MKIAFSLTLLIINLCSFVVHADLKHIDDDMYDYNGSNDTNGCREVFDPYEKFNRKVFAYNTKLDNVIFRPIAIGYKKITNDYIRARVNSFITNIDTPLSVVNSALQLNYDNTMKSIWRFIINTTFGIGGLFDVAGKMGLSINRQTFGSTLAHYGIAPGPYLVIPILGSTNVRDITDPLFTNYALNPIMDYANVELELAIIAVNKINDRYTVLPFSDYVMESSTDPYIATRSAVHQAREAALQYPANFKCRQPKKLIKP